MLRQIEEFNKHKYFFTDYVKELISRSDKSRLKELEDLRSIKLDTLIKNDIFYINDATEMLLPRYLDRIEEFGVISPTNKKPIFHNRWVIPIKDIDGKVLNLVGYSNTADERYVYGTAPYYRRRETAYGLDMLDKAYDLGYCILTEGITDTLMIKSLAEEFNVSFAMCGTHKSDFIMRQLNRCRYGIIKIPDRDKPGKVASSKWKCHRSVTLNTFIKYKDIAEMISDGNVEIVKDYVYSCIEWLKTKEHNNKDCENEELTMYI